MHFSKKIKSNIAHNLIMANFTEAQAFCIAEEIIDNKNYDITQITKIIEEHITHTKLEILKWSIGISLTQTMAIIGTLLNLSMR